jgi:hypothetical protein
MSDSENLYTMPWDEFACTPKPQELKNEKEDQRFHDFILRDVFTGFIRKSDMSPAYKSWYDSIMHYFDSITPEEYIHAMDDCSERSDEENLAIIIDLGEKNPLVFWYLAKMFMLCKKQK